MDGKSNNFDRATDDATRNTTKQKFALFAFEL
jgi:hypothetical protein